MYIYIHMCVHTHVYIHICIYTSGAFAAIRQPEVLQQTWRKSKPCPAANEEALKKGLRRASEGLKKALRRP